MKALPPGVGIQIEVSFRVGDRLLHQGVLSIGEDGEVKEFQLVGLAAQRGVYELLKTLWQEYQSKPLPTPDSTQ